MCVMRKDYFGYTENGKSHHDYRGLHINILTIISPTAATPSTPPPSSPPPTTTTTTTTTLVLLDSIEDWDDTDAVLKKELGSIYTDVPGFDEAYFGAVEGLKEVAAVVFDKLMEHDGLLYDDKIGWHGWPENAEKQRVLEWLTAAVGKIRSLAAENFSTNCSRYILRRPHQLISGSTAPRKLDTGFVGSNQVHWSNMLVLGKLEQNSEMDTALRTWLDLGRCAREVFTSQDSRRFVLGFTLCGSIMRLWSFDRVGAISSTAFNINKDGSRFVLSMLGFLRMDLKDLGYDPSIITTSNGTRFIQIMRDGKPERLIIEKLIRRSACIVGRATTCWKAHREGDKSEASLVIKDSWQYPERKDEGLLLREATDKEVVNVARYYYHGTVQVQDKDDDTQGAVRRGLDLKQGRRYRWNSNFATLDPTAKSSRGVPSTCNNTERKRTSSHLSPPGPPAKRICTSSQAESEDDPNENREHRRVVVRDYGVPIYKAKSCVSMLNAVVRCIEGYESLHAKTGILHGDISTGNLLLNEEGDSRSWQAFLIDLDLAIEDHPAQPSGAEGKTGTRPFMTIGLLLGEKHSFMHDLESFFWVILWICIHHDGPDRSRVVQDFEKLNYMTMTQLACWKKGLVVHEGDFIKKTESFTEFYQPLRPWVNHLRKIVFPNGNRWEKEDMQLYTQMKDLLSTACESLEGLDK
ncbi:hypothetical protein ASPBRDRAFT_51544 [Aspergillus brasiliensis CBS 101740]|uniref:non-specific serine/threonine protein kinase n=1 Tax=Aspergillus brasiliensis (strain CBS 101740 / IMI 381727 / IBT 21946) TaxID=767769 RepID=A0A1L9UVX9_ASPBC|nr:hypothetical protein ASPBRDRAFT_51544 [Aspergillus brasiliensis CBS 101740]